MAREVRVFGEFTLDVSAGQLFRGKHSVPLQRQPLRLLILLTSRPGNVVTREEMIAALWPRGVTVDFEQGLRFAVRQVRAALGDSRDRPTYIETRHGVGYVFKCAVATKVENAELPQAVSPTEVETLSTVPLSASGEAERPVSPPAVSVEGPPQSRRLRVLLCVAAAACALAAFVVFAVWHATHRPISLAVLPMLNLTRSASYNDLADDFTAATSRRIRVLSGRQVRVVEADLADLPREETRNALAAAAALGTGYALSSTLQKAPVGSGLQLTLEMFQAGRDEAVWTRHYEADENHLMDAVDDLSTEAIRSLPVQVKPEVHPARYISPSKAAEQAYDRGRHEFADRTQYGLNAALDDFKIATRLDPAYALAHALLAMTYEQLGGYGWMPQADAAKKSEEEIATALLLNPKLSEGLAARGYLQWFYHWNWKGAEQDLQEAIRSDSQNVDALHWYALVLATAGQTADAEQQMEKALEIEPRSKILRTNRGWLHYFAGHPEKAAVEMEEVLRDDRRFTSARVKLWAAYSLEHRYDDAFRQLTLLSDENLSEQTREALVHSYKADGYADAVRQWSQKQSESIRGNTLLRAQLAIAGNDHEGAVEVLIAAAQSHDGWLVFALRDPALRSAIDDSRVKGSIQTAGIHFGD